MGLDMHLTGDRYFRHRDATKHPRKGERFELGYWRKHPNLHGFIVQTFAHGEDDCCEIVLDEADLLQVVEAVKLEQLPQTTGFFFGVSDGSEKEDDLQILTDAIQWLTTDDEVAWRYVTYQASW